jgi:hypothetical protein
MIATGNCQLLFIRQLVNVNDLRWRVFGDVFLNIGLRLARV